MPQTETAKDTLDSYITDMLALEEHIAKAVDAQLADFRKEHPSYATTIEHSANTTARHIGALEALKTSRNIDAGSVVADAVKRAGSVVAGLGAAAIDLVRTEKLSKNLRDDYTAYSLATIGYQMLMTTAISLDDADVAERARAHFADYAKVLVELSRAIPSAVVQDLRSKGLPVNENADDLVKDAVQKVWESQ